MFTSLANYLLGTSTNNQVTADAAEGGEEANSNINNVRLTTCESDDEWVLVERDSEGNSEVSSEDSESEHNLTTRLSRTSSSSSLRCPSSMEESWFLTPPPCFVSAGPVHMETSPLENLLIEHPSMSVYHQPPALALRRHNLLDAVEDEEEVGEVEEGFVEVQAPEEEAPQEQPQQPRRHRVHLFSQEEMQGVRRKQAQKVQIQKACQSLKRGYLERNNKAREVNCRNQRLRRGERSQGATRSHANNNRKCY
ncbi:PREDICTED: tumor protein p53-inducible nuclear protein 1 isoform X2 [Nicrophorus vespilloides]|nr:PREDICTED: tumor protein p53-inducible nuclear protein 1 isoform X2 [Nicrophorus vespilloides]XP_017775034.1 PREDICTED: tumor protein p53-inducible nuclear protein 1 isoform X2 [Nicrophorus vespilloides]XP_017775035.1 PREDICTED: tumor protein p53-inducible nuclear protein 1 isoform X2 [Nicrophorus vespilloides]